MLSVVSWLPIPGLTDEKGPTPQIPSMVLSKIFILKTEILYQREEALVVAL